MTASKPSKGQISANATLMRHSLKLALMDSDMRKMITEMDLILAASVARKEDTRTIDQYVHMRGCYGLIQNRIEALGCSGKGED